MAVKGIRAVLPSENCGGRPCKMDFWVACASVCKTLASTRSLGALAGRAQQLAGHWTQLRIARDHTNHQFQTVQREPAVRRSPRAETKAQPSSRPQRNHGRLLRRRPLLFTKNHQKSQTAAQEEGQDDLDLGSSDGSRREDRGKGQSTEGDERRLAERSRRAGTVFRCGHRLGLY